MKEQTLDCQKRKRFRKHAEERHSHKVFVYLSREQHCRITQQSDIRELSISCFIRNVLKGAGII